MTGFRPVLIPPVVTQGRVGRPGASGHRLSAEREPSRFAAGRRENGLETLTKPDAGHALRTRSVRGPADGFLPSLKGCFVLN